MKFVPILLAALLTASPALAQTPPPSPLTQSENAFALDLYSQLSKTPGNLFFSPASIATALGMVYVGAHGQTATQIAHTLHLDAIPKTPTATLQQTYLQALQSQFPSTPTDNNGAILDSANALWGAAHYSFNKSYIETIKSVFHGNLTPIDFDNPKAASTEINNWVASHTAQKIQNLISPEAIDADTRLVLTNAVYFKAGWLTPFDKAQTKTESFYTGSFQLEPAQMMQSTNWYLYANGFGVQILEIPYRNDEASMIVVLPYAPLGLPNAEATLTAEKLQLLLTEMSSTEVALEIPKFKTETAFNLNAVLQNLGIETAFEPVSADFSNIISPGAERLYISDIVHKAYIAVDESGTVAAAATATEMDLAAGIEPPPPPPIPFIANHPFIYLIRDNTTGQILFLGRITDPTQTSTNP